jgi:hypothetical protein
VTEHQSIIDRQARRFAYLKYLYDDAQTVIAPAIQSLPSASISAALGLTRDECHRIEQYLSARRLVEYVVSGPEMAITADGIDYVERALAAPDDATEYFPPVNVLHIEQVVNSQIQQGVSHSLQAGSWDARLDPDRLRDAIADIRQMVDSLSLTDDDNAAVDANLATAEAQASSPRPSTMIIRESLRLVRDIVSGAGGALAGVKLEALLRGAGWL